MKTTFKTIIFLGYLIIVVVAGTCIIMYIIGQLTLK